MRPADTVPVLGEELWQMAGDAYDEEQRCAEFSRITSDFEMK